MSRTTIWLELFGSGFREQFYDAGGTRTRAIEAGEGEPLLLLHGTGGHAETYQRNVAPLAKHFRVFALDMIGHGFTDRPDLTYSLDDYADHIVAFIDALGLERAHISGESLGAMVAAWVAIRNPDRVRKIVMNTGILARPDEKGLAEIGDLGQRTKALADDLSFATVRRRMEWLVHDPEAMTDETVQCRYRIYSQPGMMDTVLRIMNSIQAIVRGTSDKDYFEPGIMKKITCPTMVLWTEHNPGQSAELARSVLGDIPDAEFHLLSDSAHWPQFENPEEFNRLHVDFLNR